MCEVNVYICKKPASSSLTRSNWYECFNYLFLSITDKHARSAPCIPDLINIQLLLTFNESAVEQQYESASGGCRICM